MFDALLGRGGFSSKCKSLIKLARTRIDAVRRKQNATQKFLKQDIADLLANGLETKALGRAEGLIAELCLSSCYDFIDHVCEIILKHLSTMQKSSDCPEECREAVASLMFSAARFSDLPELRDLRDIFRDRYGDSLECYVNQNLTEHIAPKPPNMDRKLRLLEDIASEFSITWDRAAYEQRSKAAEDKHQVQAFINPMANKYIAPSIPKPVQKIGTDDTSAKKKIEVTDKMKGQDIRDNGQEHGYNKHNSRVPPRTIPKSKDVYGLPKMREFLNDGHGSLAQENGKPGKSIAANLSSIVIVDDQRNLEWGPKAVPETEHKIAAYKVKAGPLLARDEQHVDSIGHIEKEANRLKANSRSNIPPPYVKPKKSKHRTRHSESNIDDTLTFGGAQNIAPVKDEIPHFTVEYYKSDASANDRTPRRRSRRRHHKLASAPSDSDTVEEEVRVVRRTTTSRRRNESKKGLQILCNDDDRHRTDEEERMMDKLLLHYSKKPVGSGKTKSRTNPKEDEVEDQNQQPSRSFSLPREQSSSEMKKVFTRAATFGDESSTPAKHVHPKLPDYDDLAARFAALRRK